jgi:hypothetical protein
MDTTMLDFSQVVKKLTHSRFSVVDVISNERSGMCQFIRIASRDFGYTCLLHFSEMFGLVNVETDDSMRRWLFRDLSPSDRYIPMESINIQSTVIDEADTSNFAKNMKKAYELDSAHGSLDDEHVVYINDVLRQIRRFESTCRDFKIGLAMTRSSYMVVLHEEGPQSMFIHRDPTEGDLGPPEKLFSVDYVISIQNIYKTFDTISDLLPRFERALRKITDRTTRIFANNVHEVFPNCKDSFEKALAQKVAREEKYDNDGENVREHVRKRIELIEALTKTSSRLRELEHAPEPERDEARCVDADRLDSQAREAYDAHTEKRGALLEKYARSRQRYFSWMFMLDRVVFDNVLFMEAVRRNFARLENKTYV